MLNLVNYINKLFIFIALICSTLNAVSNETTTSNSNLENKTHVVVAIPFQPGLPFDPSWYSPEYVNYIANLLPSEKYSVTGYLVSLENIPQFLDDMEKLYVEKKNLRILNFCDGGEWDGYPGISVVRQWEQRPISKLVAMSGADTDFIFNSDNKIRMNSFLKEAKLKTLPQALVPANKLNKKDLEALLAKEQLNQSWPLFCKLNIGAGALGISGASICHNIEELMTQLDRMHTDFPTSDILLQPYLVGPEYTILVVKNQVYVAVRRDFHNPENLMHEDYLTGVRPPEEEISYYPAPIEAQALALQAIQAVPGKHHYTRVDLRNDAQGNTYVLDINDRPGFGSPSTIKCMLDYHNLSEADLLLEIVKTCVQQ